MTARTEFEDRAGRFVSQTVYHCKEAGLAAHTLNGVVTLTIADGVLQSVEWGGAEDKSFTVSGDAQPEIFVPSTTSSADMNMAAAAGALKPAIDTDNRKR